MRFPDVVGRRREALGSEEACRRTVSQPAPAAGADARGRRSISERTAPHYQRLLLRRARLHVAGLAALGLIVLLALALPLRTVRIAVDGKTITTHSRSVDSNALVQQAGVMMRAGDRVEAQGGDAIAVRRAANVLLSVDGKTYTVRAQSATVKDLLDRTGVALGPDDSVLRNGVFVSPSASLAPAPASRQETIDVQVRRAVPFTVVENGQGLPLRSSRETIAAALHDAGVRLGAGDEVQPPLDTPLTAGLQVHVHHASELVVTLPEGKSTVYTLAPTVGEALAASDVPLPADYRLDPPADTMVSAGLAVHVIGVSQQQELETERIQSYVVYQPDSSLPPGAQRTVAGQDGVHYRQYALVYEDGQLVTRELASEWDDPAPVDTVVYYSTAPVPVTAAEVSAAWQDLVCSYDWDCAWATAVILCESGGNPDAYNPQGYVGLFQIWEGFGGDLRDPATNIAAAYSLYVSGGPGNWPNCP